MSAGHAQLLAGELFEAVEIDAFSAAGADDAIGFVAGQLGGIDVDADAIESEKLSIVEFAIGEHLLLALAFDFGMKLAREIARGFERDDACARVLREIDEGCGHFSPVAKFQSALAEAAPGHHANRIGGAAVDFDKGDEALAICAERVFDAEGFESEEGHADAEDLAGAHVAVGSFSALEESVERVGHHYSDSPSAAVGRKLVEAGRAHATRRVPDIHSSAGVLQVGLRHPMNIYEKPQGGEGLSGIAATFRCCN